MAHILPGLLLVLLAGCGGTQLLKNPGALPETAALATGTDGRVAVSVDHVVVPNGPGSWARHGHWDEYLLRLKAVGAPVRIESITLADALGTRIESQADRGALEEASAEIERRYQASGQLARGVDGGWMIAAGAAGVAGGLGVMASGMVGGVTLSGATFAGTTGAAAILGPAIILGGVGLAGAGIVRLANEAEVDDQIKRRHTPLPVQVDETAKAVSVFFPVTPLPSRLDVAYSALEGTRVLQLDTRESLARAHVPPPMRLLERPEPIFPEEAARAGQMIGRVKARLTVDRNGDVVGVEILEAEPPSVFNLRAYSVLRASKYTPGTDGREALAEIVFRR